jgi:uncharacterized delta-60 repeat protein
MYKDLYIKATSGSTPPPIDNDIDTHFVTGESQASMASLDEYIGTISRLETNGDRDESFYSGVGFPNGQALGVVIQPDEKVIYISSDTEYAGNYNRIVRINSSGSADTTFNIGTGFNFNPSTIVLQPDDKILVGGSFTQYSGSTTNRLVRINTNGTRDTGFNIGTGFNNTASAIAVQPDDKILVGGSFTQYSGSSINRLVRINTNGTRDTSFNVGTGLNSIANTIAIQSDDKILVGGSFDQYSGSSINFLVRINTDGTRDTGFNIGTGLSSTANAIAIQSDNKILVGGAFTAYSGSTTNYLVRINTDGTRDTGFNIGTGFNNVVNTIFIQPDDKILVGGSFTTLNDSPARKLVRLNSDGTLDTTFTSRFDNSGGITSNGIALDSSNKIYFASSNVFYNRKTNFIQNGLIVFNKDGKINNNFTQVGGNNINQGGGIINDNTKEFFIFTRSTLVSTFPLGAGGYSTYLAKFKDGILDTDFIKNQGSSFNLGAFSGIDIIKFQPDNKIIIGGSFTLFNNITRNRFLRLNDNGTEDTSFNNNLGTGFDDEPLAIAIQSDNKILVGGGFTQYSGSTTNRLVRINTDGTRDTGFNIGTGFNGLANIITIQPDDKILVGGSFTQYSGSTTNRLVRINTDGTRDTGFNIGTGISGGFANVITIQPDDKILVGGSFTAYSGSTVNRLVRINTDGTLDSTFTTNLGTGFNNTANVITLQPDNKILVGGSFTTLNSVIRGNLVRLNSDGTLDTTFSTNLGNVNGTSFISIGFQSDGKILIGGKFNNINNFSARQIARINTDGTRDFTYKGTLIISPGSVSSISIFK